VFSRDDGFGRGGMVGGLDAFVSTCGVLIYYFRFLMLGT
jgi:hypothetical protein